MLLLQEVCIHISYAEDAIANSFQYIACYGTFLFVLFADFGLAFWYAGKLVGDDTYPGWRVIAALFGVLIGSMSILSVPGHLGAVSTARGAAYRIFKTIDRIPLIDIDSDAGIRPEKIMGDIEFRNVNFAYPTRPGMLSLS